ncbi:12453_t:CDS:2, partial [Entrophospora sp. SA101]
MNKARNRSKVLESIALRNKIAKNIEDIKEDIVSLKKDNGVSAKAHITKKIIASSCGDSGYINW